MAGCLRFSLASLACLMLALLPAEGATAHITWTITPGTQTYVNDQTKIGFAKSVGGFRLHEANPAKADGSATFFYWGKRGIITVYFAHRGPMGCGPGVDCARRDVEGFRAEMKRLHGKFDLERAFRLQRRGSKNIGWGAVYHFLAFPNGTGRPVYSEVGAVEAGDFVFSYRGTFVDKAGLDDLARFVGTFGVTRR